MSYLKELVTIENNKQKDVSMQFSSKYIWFDIEMIDIFKSPKYNVNQRQNTRGI